MKPDNHSALTKRNNQRVWLLAMLLLTPVSSAMAWEWADLWLTPDQQGQQLMDQGEYLLAANKFTSPLNIGSALFMAGDFEKAATVFGRSANAEAHYNRGNALMMLGEYDASIEAYQNALAKRPNWSEAEENLRIANLRKLALATPTDDFGGTDGKLKADGYVFDKAGGNNNSSDEQVIDATEQTLSEDAMRAIWLRKVETRPADFLAARFNYQLASREQDDDE